VAVVRASNHQGSHQLAPSEPAPIAWAGAVSAHAQSELGDGRRAAPHRRQPEI